jgi:hypothetical protein
MSRPANLGAPAHKNTFGQNNDGPNVEVWMDSPYAVAIIDGALGTKKSAEWITLSVADDRYTGPI